MLLLLLLLYSALCGQISVFIDTSSLFRNNAYRLFCHSMNRPLASERAVWRWLHVMHAIVSHERSETPLRDENKCSLACRCRSRLAPCVCGPDGTVNSERRRDNQQRREGKIEETGKRRETSVAGRYRLATPGAIHFTSSAAALRSRLPDAMTSRRRLATWLTLRDRKTRSLWCR